MPSCKPASLKVGPAVDVADLLAAPRRLPLVMGIVNVTPDSFFEGSRAPSSQAAADRALAFCEEGADLLDIGGQSTRPGSDPVSLDEELARVMPVLEALAPRVKVPLSIDTDKAEVARLALEAGASIVNDVSAFRADPKMLATCLKAQAVIAMHRGGDSPKTMQSAPKYADVVKEVAAFLAERLHAFQDAGGQTKRLLIDPGIGFGKTYEHNLSLLKHLDVLADMGRPIVLGVSRKSFLGRAIAASAAAAPGPEERLEGSLAVACWAMLSGVKVLRVHDVKATQRALRTLSEVLAAA
jgi:dihydropteroate synthase